MGQTRHQLHAAHLARLARMAANAKPDPGIQLHNGKPVPASPDPLKLLLPNINGSVEAHYAPGWDFAFARAADINSPAITVDLVIRTVARRFGLSRRDLLRPRRTVNIARPRQIAMYLAAEHTGCSLPYIGKRFGNMDHTTILHGRERITELIKSDPVIAAEVVALEHQLGIWS